MRWAVMCIVLLGCGASETAEPQVSAAEHESLELRVLALEQRTGPPDLTSRLEQLELVVADLALRVGALEGKPDLQARVGKLESEMAAAELSASGRTAELGKVGGAIQSLVGELDSLELRTGELESVLGKPSCPTDMLEMPSGVCVESAQRAAATLNEADAACYLEERRICTLFELIEACKPSTEIATLSSPEWTSTFVATDSVVLASYLACVPWESGTVGDAAFGKHPFRCCLDPRYPQWAPPEGL